MSTVFVFSIVIFGILVNKNPTFNRKFGSPVLVVQKGGLMQMLIGEYLNRVAFVVSPEELVAMRVLINNLDS